MDAISALRRRRPFPKRDEYSLLQDDGEVSQYSYSSRTPGSEDSIQRQPGPNKLCDKCWQQHTRARATRRCLKCQQNLCITCAKQDEIKRPWWLPACLAHCMRVLFSYVYIPHSIVDLDDWIKEQEHWAMRTEASNVNRIPRVSRDSLRMRNRANRVSGPKAQDFVDKRFSDSREMLLDNENQVRRHRDRVARSKSHEEVTKGLRAHPRLVKRSISVEKINKRLNKERKERDKIYNRNWDGAVGERTRRRSGVRSNQTGKPDFVNKVKGKDIDIVISGSEMKLTVNEDDASENNTNKKEHGHKEGIFRRKSKSKTTDKPYKPYTEEIFSENPIWFKKDSGKKRKSETNNRLKKNEEQIKCRRSEDSGNTNGGFDDNVTRQRSEDTKEYLVQEPPDQCPICLEDLPGSEARMLSCAHLLHTKCLMHYLQGTDNLDFGIRCPMCNRITEIRNYYAPRDLWYREVPVSTHV